MFDASVMHVKTRFSEPLSLEKVVGVCPGFVRATQLLKIGKEVIASDDVLIEEVAYPSLEKMNAELKSFSLKAGLFSAYDHMSVPPPKYAYPDAKQVMTWFITPVPPVTLADVLSEIKNRYPSYYTWNRFAYVRDVARTIIACVRPAWRHSRNPIAKIRWAVRLYISSLPQQLQFRERLALAALLVEPVRQKHLAGIYHNNIFGHTVFFPHATAPRFLNNYSGLEPEVMAQHVPPAIRNRDARFGFGPQSQDTFCLALATYVLAVGEPLDGETFELDEPVAFTRPAPGFMEKRFTGILSFINPIMKAVKTAWCTVFYAYDECIAVLDESNWPRFRNLNRATGSIVRSIPFLRKFLNIWFPTKTAWALRIILDYRTNESIFGPAGKFNKSLKVKRNADCSFLAYALPKKALSGKSRLARMIQEIIDENTVREN
jgi:hypothetical protein